MIKIRASAAIKACRFPGLHCGDGFLGAFWRRPAAYLDPDVRRGISGFTQLPSGALDEGLARLAADLDDGRWDARFGHLRTQHNVDLGYRLLIAEPRPRH